jgi:hypothetical protein
MDDITQGERPASGRFVLRIDPRLHEVLRTAAAGAGMSLNEYCARKLADPGRGTGGPAAGAVRRALDVAGEGLVGVLAYGSWAREEFGAESDVDVLVVVDGSVAISRGLYRSWDAEPVCWEAHAVEPHFVHLPGPSDRLTGTWAEAAVEGVVLYERGFELSKRLVALRRRIADGALVRRRAHGQPYWVEAA